MGKEHVINETAKWVVWWLDQRKRKLREHLSDSMSVNPFLWPIIFDLHNISSFSELNDLLIGCHLITGHNTGFGKLIDEKILPYVFNTKKLDKAFRKSHAPFHLSCYDEIDHVVTRPNDKFALLSLKASKWTIQLTMAVQLNRAFEEILKKFPEDFVEIAVGVFYGKRQNLTDKYDILRGVNRGANHDVVDLTHKVRVYPGREFWQWVNFDMPETQDWVLEGILKGLKDDNARQEGGQLLQLFKDRIMKEYANYIDGNGNIKWHELLKDING